MTADPNVLTDDDGTDLSPADRLRQAAEWLETAGTTDGNEVIRLLSLAALRVARLKAASDPGWAHVASAQLTLCTLKSELIYNDPFSQIPLPLHKFGEAL